MSFLEPDSPSPDRRRQPREPSSLSVPRRPDNGRETYSPSLVWMVEPQEILRTELPPSISIQGTRLPLVSQAALRFTTTGLEELLAQGLRQNPMLVGLFREYGLDRPPSDLKTTGSPIHLITKTGGSSVVMPVRSERIQAFFEALSLRARTWEFSLERGLADRISQRASLPTCSLLPIYGVTSDEQPTLTVAELHAAFAARSHSSGLRAYRFCMSQWRSELEQYNSSETILPLPADLDILALLAPTLRLRDEGYQSDIDKNSKRIASLSALHQAALYRLLFTGREHLLRGAAPIAIPDHVMPYMSPDEITRSVGGATRSSEGNYYHVSWEWLVASSEHQRVIAEVRFHTKVSDSLGETLPCFVVELSVRDIPANRAERFTLVDSGAGSDIISQLQSSGISLRGKDRALFLAEADVNRASQPRLRSKRFPLNSSQADSLEEQEARKKEESLVALIRRAIHFECRPELAGSSIEARGSLTGQVDEFLSKPPLAIFRSGPNLEERLGSGKDYEAAKTLREMFIRRPMMHGPGFSSGEHLEVSFVSGHYTLLHYLRDQQTATLWDFRPDGTLLRETTMTEKDGRPLFHSSDRSLDRLRPVIDRCKRLLLFQYCAAEIGNLGAFGLAEVERGQVEPAASILPGLFKNAMLHWTEDRRGLVQELVTSSPDDEAKRSARVLCHLDRSANERQLRLERLTLLPDNGFFGSARLSERFCIDAAGTISSREADLFGRSVLVVLPPPSEASCLHFLARVPT